MEKSFEKDDTDDKVKAFWDERPCNIRHSAKAIGSEEYFREVTKRKYFVEPHISPFADFEAYAGKKVLEVGCGIGTAAQSFMQAGAIYTGIDVSPKSILIANQRMDVFHLRGEVRIDDIQRCQLKDDEYDLVYSFGVLHHIADLSSALKNIHKTLKVHGEFKLMMYAKNSWKNACIEAGLDQFEAQSGVPIANTYTNDEIECILRQHGFTDVTIKQDHIFQWSIPEYKNYEYKKEPWFATMPEELVRTLETKFGWHLLIKCRKN